MTPKPTKEGMRAAATLHLINAAENVLPQVRGRTAKEQLCIAIERARHAIGIGESMQVGAACTLELESKLRMLRTQARFLNGCK